MRRREFIILLGGATIAPCFTAQAQQRTSAKAQRVRRIGVLMAYGENDRLAQSYISALLNGLANLGWSDGGNVKIDVRWADGDVNRMSLMAKELIDLQPDLIFAHTTPVTAAVTRETRTIPIIFAIVSDPVGAGFVDGLSRPGRNITGYINVEAAMGGKWLELLKDVAPRVQRVGVLYNPPTAPGGGQYFLPSVETAARSLGASLMIAPVYSDAEIEEAIASLARGPSAGIVVLTDAFMLIHRQTVIAAAAKYKLPVVGHSRVWATEGAVLAYGQDSVDIFRRASTYCDRVMRGERPNDLPVQVPTKFEFVVNLKIARALGIEVPSSLLARADEVIE